MSVVSCSKKKSDLWPWPAFKLLAAETLRSGNALEFASTSLRAERMVVLTAVRENKGAMAYASKEILGWEGRTSWNQQIKNWAVLREFYLLNDEQQGGGGSHQPENEVELPSLKLIAKENRPKP